MKRLLSISTIALVIFCFTQTTHANAITYTGTRTYAEGSLLADDEWASSVTSITFEVIQLPSGDWSYTYAFTYPAGPGSDPMQFIKLQVSSDVPDATYGYIDGGSGAYLPLVPRWEYFHLWDTPASDPCYSLYALYIGPYTNTEEQLVDGSITFISSQGPMWGSFYARGPSGDPPEMMNEGFPGDFSSTYSWIQVGSEWIKAYDYNGSSAPTFDGTMIGADSWILVPDTFTHTTPEPGTLLLLGLGLIGLAGTRRKFEG